MSPPTGIRSSDLPGRSESLYRLSYPLYLVVHIVTTGLGRGTYLPIDPAEPHNTFSLCCSSSRPPVLYTRNKEHGWCSTWCSTESRDLHANLSHAVSKKSLFLILSSSLPMWNKPSSCSGPPSSTTTLIPLQHVIVVDHNRISCRHSISKYSAVHMATRAQVFNVWSGSGALINLFVFL